MKFTVTPELAVLLKTIRTQNNISSKDLAVFLGKSPSYISKLEGGSVKNIDSNDLKSIFNYEYGSDDFYGVTLPAVGRVMEGFMAAEDYLRQTWFMQYDVIERPVKIPQKMAEDISKRLDDLNLSVYDFVKMINANLDLENASSYPVNEIMAVPYESTTRMVIRVNVDEKDILDITSGKRDTLYYMVANSVVFLLFRLSLYGDSPVKIPPEKAAEVLRYTSTYLSQYQIHSLTAFSHLISSDEFILRQKKLVYGEQENPDCIKQIVEYMNSAIKHDTLSTTYILENFSDAISWDPAFVLAIMGLPFNKLNGLGYKKKRELIDDIESLFDEYNNLSEFEKKFENY